jgi:O-antigen/teichoic acid export membrane protein
VSAVFFWLNPLYYASGKIGLWTKVYGLYAVLAIGLSWFCIQQWGFFGMATVVAVGKVLFTLWMTARIMVSGKLSNESIYLPSSR